MTAAALASPIVLRAASGDDIGFAVSTWAQEAVRDVAGAPGLADLFPAGSQERITLKRAIEARARRLIAHGELIVAAFDEAPAYLLGWVCVGNGALHFVYVRSEHRGGGVCRMLLDSVGWQDGPVTHWSGHLPGGRYEPERLRGPR